MKRNSRLLSVLVLTLAFAFMFVSIGAPVAAAGKAKNVIVVGTLQKSGDDYVVKAGKATVTVTGQDFTEFEGKKVKITGVAGPDASKKTVVVSKIEEITGKKGSKSK